MIKFIGKASVQWGPFVLFFFCKETKTLSFPFYLFKYFSSTTGGMLGRPSHMFSSLLFLDKLCDLVQDTQLSGAQLPLSFKYRNWAIFSLRYL